MAGKLLMTVGGVLQIAGVALIFNEISQAERALQLRSWIRQTIGDITRPIFSLAQRLGLRKPRRVLVGLSASVGVSASLAARARVTYAEGITVDERLESHRKQLAALRDELDKVWQSVDQARGDQGKVVTETEARLMAEIASVQALVTELGGGGLRLRAIGGVFIVLGTLLIMIGVWL